MIEAKVILDSISDNGARLTTMKLRFPKLVLAEFNTHRMFSRNASSSRAIPTKKLIEEVRSKELRARPVFWGANKPGMQADEELTGDARKLAEQVWDHAACDAAYHAQRLLDRGAHKQIVNRVLEPFTHANVIVSSTEWMNFFGLRLDKDAQPEMRMLAEAMWTVYNESVSLRLSHYQWHLPFISAEDAQEIRQMLDPPQIYPWLDSKEVIDTLIKVSVARCARVSYESHDTGRRSTVQEDVALYQRLIDGGHWSPLEHVATPDEWEASPEEHGNFRGWRQWRKMHPGEAIRPLPEEYRT